MSTGSIVLMVLGLAVTWGGAAVCITIAMRKRDI
ncbi:MAG: MetS family NSS transporter small subunit [Thermodesulfobacteriota bacterium]